MTIIDSLLGILSWFFNPERWKARRDEDRLKEMKKWEDTLAKALIENDTKTISIARATLKTLRDKYKVT